MDRRIEAIEERIAHLERVVEDLSDVLTSQQAALDRLARAQERLAAHEAAREAEAGLAPPDPNQRPPHW